MGRRRSLDDANDPEAEDGEMLEPSLFASGHADLHLAALAEAMRRERTSMTRR